MRAKFRYNCRLIIFYQWPIEVWDGLMFISIGNRSGNSCLGCFLRGKVGRTPLLPVLSSIVTYGDVRSHHRYIMRVDRLGDKALAQLSYNHISCSGQSDIHCQPWHGSMKTNASNCTTIRDCLIFIRICKKELFFCLQFNPNKYPLSFWSDSIGTFSCLL